MDDFVTKYWWAFGIAAIVVFLFSKSIDGFAASTRQKENEAFEALYARLHEGMSAQEVTALAGNSGTHSLEGELEVIKWSGVNGQILEVEMRAGRLTQKRLRGLSSG